MGQGRAAFGAHPHIGMSARIAADTCVPVARERHLPVQRIVILGRGGAGKSTLARLLGARTGIRVFELDKQFWGEGLRPTSPEVWRDVQAELATRSRWIMDGDLGPYDEVEIRLAAADTVLVLDYPLIPCAWRSLRRSRERLDYWRWLVLWRARSRPPLLRAIARCAPDAQLVIARNPVDIERFLSTID
jgi:hypothetical protein